MSEIQKFITRYSRDFSGNLSVDPNGSWVLAADAAIRDKRVNDELAALREENRLLNHDIASFLETTAKVCELLGIDTDDARHAEGKPSDVLFSHATALQQRLADAERRNAELEKALKFYADRDHYSTDDQMNWDSCSGEPSNILWHESEPWFIEDGSIARAALNKPEEDKS